MTHLRLHAFPAREGDCLLVEYGDPARPWRVLIDGGRRATYAESLKPFLQAIPESERRLELFVVTHVDRDHVEGAVALADDQELPLDVDDIWFNAYPHLSGNSVAVRKGRLGVLAAPDGERLTAAIRKRDWPWNKAFDGAPVSLRDDVRPIVKTLAGGASIHLLSPDARKLATMKPAWERDCRRAGLTPGAGMTGGGAGRAGKLAVLGERRTRDLAALAARPTPPDDAAANGSSIAFIFEYAGQRIFFAADAHPDLLLASIKQLPMPLAIALAKVSHHGSKSNTTVDLCRLIGCDDVLISTNGAMFDHPDEEALARIIVGPPGAKRIHFNYRNKITGSWDDKALKLQYGYDATYPAKDDGFCILEMIDDRLIRTA